MKRVCVTGLLVALALTWAFSSSAKATPQEVRLLSSEYPPYLGSQLRGEGPFTEIVKAAFKLGGYDSTSFIVPWARALKVAQRGEYDGLFPAWYTAKRAQHFVYSTPFVPSEIGFYKLKGKAIDYQRLADLKPYSIGIVRGYNNPPGFDKAELTTITVTKDEQNMVLLCQKHIDLALTDKVVGAYIVKNKYSECADKIEWLTTLKINPHHLVISKKVKGHQVKMAAFNRGLAQLKQQGLLDKILTKHGIETR